MTSGKTLAPRLTVYPEYVRDPESWLHPDVRFPVLLHSDAEGLAREVNSRVNGMRKEFGLEKNENLAIEDRIRLELFHSGDATLAAALERHRSFIAAETLAVELVIAAEPPSRDGVETFDLGDGKRLGVRIARA